MNVGVKRQSFPEILHQMLQDSDTNNFSEIVSWLSDNTSFKVHEPKRFASEIMGRYFRQTKYKSFIRQLNIYGFARIHCGSGKGGYSHPFFTKSLPDLCHRIKATPRKKQQKAGGSSETANNALIMSAATSLLQQQQQQEQSVPLEAQDINAALRLMKQDPFVINQTTSSSQPITSTDESSGNSFPFKLYKMLEDTENQKKSHIVSWVDSGMAFQVHDPKAFMSEIAPYYFDFGKYESFRRQLIYWGFERGRHRCHFHKNFKKGFPQECMGITRRQSKKNKEQDEEKSQLAMLISATTSGVSAELASANQLAV